MTRGFSHIFLLRKSRFGLLITLITLMELFLSMHNAQAYMLTGLRWSGQPTSGCCATLYYNLDPNMYTSSPIAWNNGANAWRASSANLNYYSSISSVPIYLTDQWSSDTWDALSSWTASGSNYSGATAWINVRKSPGYSAAQLQAATVHELGHIAALQHGSGCVIMNSDSIGMYNNTAVCGTGRNVPQSDDINGINAVY